MSAASRTTGTMDELTRSKYPLSEPCIMVIFGASGDLTRRLLMPALYNLCCDGLLNDSFAVLGTGRSEFTDDTFRENMAGAENGLRAFHTRNGRSAGIAVGNDLADHGIVIRRYGIARIDMGFHANTWTTRCVIGIDFSG